MKVANAPISLLIAVGVRLYREGLATALGSRERLSVAATAGSSDEALAAVLDIRPDVAIIDVTFPDTLGLMRSLRERNRVGRILAFAVREEDVGKVSDYARAGACAFVTASGTLADLVEVIHRTAAGELLCSASMASELLRVVTNQLGPAPGSLGKWRVTSREAQVLRLMKQGRSNKEIAAQLNIAPATVKNHVHHILEKLQVDSRGKAASVVEAFRVTGTQI